MDAKYILSCLCDKYTKDAMYMCNVYVFNNGSECDFVTIDYKDFTHEFEVKISRSDFKADFKKEKHQFFEALLTGEKMVTVRGSEVNATCDISFILDRYEYWATIS